MLIKNTRKINDLLIGSKNIRVYLGTINNSDKCNNSMLHWQNNIATINALGVTLPKNKN